MKLRKILAFGLFMMAGLVQAQTSNPAPSSVPQRMMMPRLYHQNYFYLNPAFAGAEGRRELGFNTHLNSLAGNSSSAPLSVLAYYQGTVGDTTRNGVGAIMLYDQFGPYWLGKFGLTYAKRFRLGEQSNIAIGAQLAAEYMNVDLAEYSRLTPGSERMVGHDNDLRPDVDAGIWLNIRNFYAGATFASLLRPTFNLLGGAEHKDERELFLTTGYKFQIAEQISFTPSVFFDKPLKGGKFGKQYSALANIKFLALGATYRDGERFDSQQAPWSINAGVNFSDRVSFLTSYDLTEEENGFEPDPQVEASLKFRF